MWTTLVVTVFVLAHAEASFIEPFESQDEIIKNYKTARALLTPEQEEFLMELLAADDALIEQATSRGIIDDFLQVLAGVGSGVRINVVGGSGNTMQSQQPAAAAAPPSSMPASNANISPASSNAPASDIVAPVSAAPAPAMSPPANSPTTNANTTAIGGENNHLFSTISSVIMSSNGRNVTGIVDQSLRIATPAPIREFVTSILNVVYCNSVRRVLGRC